MNFSGIGLPRSDFVRAEYIASEVRVKICGLQVFLNLLSRTTGRNTKRDAQRLDKPLCALTGRSCALNTDDMRCLRLDSNDSGSSIPDLVLKNFEALRQLHAAETGYQFVTGNLMAVVGQHLCKNAIA